MSELSSHALTIPKTAVPVAEEYEVSASQVELFHNGKPGQEGGCEAKWGFKYISKLVRPAHPSAIKGTRLHGYQERYLKTGALPDQGDPIGVLAAAGLHLLPRPNTGEYDARGVEIPFSLRRPNGVKWRGAIDLAILDNGGWPIVLDHKTTGDAKWALTPTTLPKNLQANVYAWAVGHKSGADTVLLRWVYYATKTRAKVWPVDASIRTDAADEFLRNGPDNSAKRIIELIKERPDPQDLPKNLATCGKYGGCPYSDVCKRDTFSLFFPVNPKALAPMNFPPPPPPAGVPGLPQLPPPPAAASSAAPAVASPAVLQDLLARANSATPPPPAAPAPAELVAALGNLAPPPAGPAVPAVPPAAAVLPPPSPAAVVQASAPPPDASVLVPPTTAPATPPLGTWFRDQYQRNVYGCATCGKFDLDTELFARDPKGKCSCGVLVNQFDQTTGFLSQQFNPPAAAAAPAALPMPPPPPPAAAPAALPMPPALGAPVAPAVDTPPKGGEDSAPRRGRKPGSKNKVKADTVARVAGPTAIGTLYVDCRPDDGEVTDLHAFVTACNAMIATIPEHASVTDYRQIDYGKGPAYLLVAARNVAFGDCDAMVVSTRDPSYAILRPFLESIAETVVRAVSV